MSDKYDIEKLSAETHQIYCDQYLKNNGKPYRTNGDYSKLDEPTKDYDRAFVRWAIERFTPKVSVQEINKIIQEVRCTNLNYSDVAQAIVNYLEGKKCSNQT